LWTICSGNEELWCGVVVNVVSNVTTDAGMICPPFIKRPFKGHVMNQIPQSRTRVVES